MKRLFSALLISREAREHLVHALRPIRENNPRDLRWTDPDNWHITLSFHGLQPNDPVDLLQHLAQAAGSSARCSSICGGRVPSGTAHCGWVSVVTSPR